jgi:sterol 3beta-glucosyltransferase
MKISLLSYGTYGDVLPYISLAIALQQRGHEVVLAASENFRDAVERAGITYASLRGDTREILSGDEPRRLMAMGNALQWMNEIRRRMDEIRPRLIDDARDASGDAEVIVASSLMSFLAEACASVHRCPLVLSELTPLTPASIEVSSILTVAQAAALRVRWGLPAHDENPDTRARRLGALVLHGFSQHIVPKQPAWTDTHHVTGAWHLPSDAAHALHGVHHDPELAAWLREGEPPLYFGMGSSPVPTLAEAMRLMSSVCDTLGARALIGTGWLATDGVGEDPSARVVAIGPCDHEWLFPQCRAIVHHGGAGSVHVAARAGVPQVVCSVSGDQPFWGQMLARIGVAAHVPLQRLTSETLRDAVMFVSGDEVRARAADLGARVRAEGGAAHAADAIEASCVRSGAAAPWSSSPDQKGRASTARGPL